MLLVDLNKYQIFYTLIYQITPYILFIRSFASAIKF